MSKPHKRGAVTKKTSQIVSVWLPKEVVTLLDQEVRQQDTDRSKEIRKALRSHLRTS